MGMVLLIGPIVTFFLNGPIENVLEIPGMDKLILPNRLPTDALTPGILSVLRIAGIVNVLLWAGIFMGLAKEMKPSLNCGI
ncbi:hypothetical protein D3C73_1001730 [compost metagenome]